MRNCHTNCVETSGLFRSEWLIAYQCEPKVKRDQPEIRQNQPRNSKKHIIIYLLIQYLLKNHSKLSEWYDDSAATFCQCTTQSFHTSPAITSPCIHHWCNIWHGHSISFSTAFWLSAHTLSGCQSRCSSYWSEKVISMQTPTCRLSNTSFQSFIHERKERAEISAGENAGVNIILYTL